MERVKDILGTIGVILGGACILIGLIVGLCIIAGIIFIILNIGVCYIGFLPEGFNDMCSPSILPWS